MAFDFDALSKRLTRAGQEVTEKVKETAGIVQLRQKKASAEHELESLFAEIGKAYYDQHREEENEELSELFAKVNEAKAKIHQLQEELNQLRKTRTCPECGAELPLDAVFCSKCGAALPVPEPEEEEEPEVEEPEAEEPEAEVIEIPEDETEAEEPEEEIPVTDEVDCGDDFAPKTEEEPAETEE